MQELVCGSSLTSFHLPLPLSPALATTTEEPKKWEEPSEVTALRKPTSEYNVDKSRDKAANSAERELKKDEVAQQVSMYTFGVVW